MLKFMIFNRWYSGGFLLRWPWISTLESENKYRYVQSTRTRTTTFTLMWCIHQQSCERRRQQQ